MAHSHGGKRANSGRKPRAERFAKPIASAEKRIADKLPEVVDTLLALATGSSKRVEERFQAAGTILRDDVLRDPLTGEPERDGRGNFVKIRVPMFPDLPPDELVLVDRKEIEIGADRAAAEYLTDRILGKPVALVEQDITSNGETLAPNIEIALAKVYGNGEGGPEQ